MFNNLINKNREELDEVLQEWLKQIEKHYFFLYLFCIFFFLLKERPNAALFTLNF